MSTGTIGGRPRAMELDAVASVAKVMLNSRLVAGLLCTTAFMGQRAATTAQAVVIVSLMGVVLALLLRWDDVAPVLMQHPAFVAADVTLMFVGLAVVGVDSPFRYVVAASAALAGLVLAWRGAQVFAPVFFPDW